MKQLRPGRYTSSRGWSAELIPHPDNKPSESQFAQLKFVRGLTDEALNCEYLEGGYFQIHTTLDPERNAEQEGQFIRELNEAGRHFAHEMGTELLITVHCF